MSAWSHGPIESAILLEFPAPHAGEHITLWLARTNTNAYYYERADGNPLYKDNKPPHETKQPLDVEVYDKLFSVVSTWGQKKPLLPEATPKGAISGYNGVISLYNAGSSRQMLLTAEDFAVCETKQCETWKPGRLMEALRLIPTFGADQKPNK